MLENQCAQDFSPMANGGCSYVNPSKTASVSSAKIDTVPLIINGQRFAVERTELLRSTSPSANLELVICLPQRPQGMAFTVVGPIRMDKVVEKYPVATLRPSLRTANKVLMTVMTFTDDQNNLFEYLLPNQATWHIKEVA
jgi:hypothetical protein